MLPYLLIFITLIVSSIPLYIATRFLGGHTSIIRVMFVNIFVGLIVVILRWSTVSWWPLIALVALIFVYSAAFNLGITEAIFAWAIQIVIVIALLFLFKELFNVTGYAVMDLVSLNI